MHELLPWLVIGFAVLLIGVTKSGFGAGVGLIIVPLTALGMASLPGYSERAALGLLLPLLILGDFVACFQYRHLLDARLLRLLALPTLLGVAVGAGLLYAIHQVGGRAPALAAALIRLEIGLECVILVGLHYYGVMKGQERKLLPEPLRSWLAGSYAGVSSTVAHAAGPVAALYLLPLKLTRDAYVGTCAMYFAALNCAKLPAYWASGQFEYLSLSFTASWMPLVLAGALLGRWVVKKVNDKAFGHIVYSSTMLMGVYLIADATYRLMTMSR